MIFRYSVALFACLGGTAVLAGSAMAQSYPPTYRWGPPPPAVYADEAPPPAPGVDEDDDLEPLPPAGGVTRADVAPPGAVPAGPPPGYEAPPPPYSAPPGRYGAAPPPDAPPYGASAAYPPPYTDGPVPAPGARPAYLPRQAPALSSDGDPVPRPPEAVGSIPAPADMTGAVAAPSAAAPSAAAPGAAAQNAGAAPNSIFASLPPDVRPEVDSKQQLPPNLRRQFVEYQTKEPTGTLIVDTPNTYLYLVLGKGQALRYGIGVGREGFTWTGVERIARMAEWPDWFPPEEMIQRQPYLPRVMAGGPGNPLGARALYLGHTLYRIHGTNQPSTIGTFVSSGCIRLTNEDVEDLYQRVKVGTRVVVLPGKHDATASAGHVVR